MLSAFFNKASFPASTTTVGWKPQTKPRPKPQIDVVERIYFVPYQDKYLWPAILYQDHIEFVHHLYDELTTDEKRHVTLRNMLHKLQPPKPKNIARLLGFQSLTYVEIEATDDRAQEFALFLGDALEALSDKNNFETWGDQLDYARALDEATAFLAKEHATLPKSWVQFVQEERMKSSETSNVLGETSSVLMVNEDSTKNVAPKGISDERTEQVQPNGPEIVKPNEDHSCPKKDPVNEESRDQQKTLYEPPQPSMKRSPPNEPASVAPDASKTGTDAEGENSESNHLISSMEELSSETLQDDTEDKKMLDDSLSQAMKDNLETKRELEGISNESEVLHDWSPQSKGPHDSEGLSPINKMSSSATVVSVSEESGISPGHDSVINEKPISNMEDPGILVNDSFDQAAMKLIFVGWNHRKYPDLGEFYLKPGASIQNGKINEDYYDKEGLKDFLKVTYEWCDLSETSTPSTLPSSSSDNETVRQKDTIKKQREPASISPRHSQRPKRRPSAPEGQDESQTVSLKKSRREHSSEESDDFYNMAHLWPLLKRLGWHWEPSRNRLRNYCYVRPGRSQLEGNHHLVDFFYEEEEVVDYCRMNNYRENYDAAEDSIVISP